MARTPWMRLPMSFVPPVVRDILEQAWREEMAEGIDVAHGSSTPVNYLSTAHSRVSGNPAPPARGLYFWVPAFAGTSGMEMYVGRHILPASRAIFAFVVAATCNS